ncbi:hypothetical protein AMATHDRAFT_137895, partial [Amanita thiersii Skay4041]
STVQFPSAVPDLLHKQHPPHGRPPLLPLSHLPFRRISLPTPTSLLNRHSIISVASFDSMPEDQPPNTLSNRPNRTRKKSVDAPQQSPGISSDPIYHSRAVKRRKIIKEFYDTERVYVDGLDLIYSHFLSPLIASLEAPNTPILDRPSLTKLFSNFIDIWNLHRSFLESLTASLTDSRSSSGLANCYTVSLLIPILLSHFPYLSLYTPFITAFPSILSTLTDLTTPSTFSNPNSQYSKRFADFLVKQEKDPKCGKLKFRDWILTIVQRCPRYLLLLKDLQACMVEGVERGEYERLNTVLELVSKITSALNTSLQAHAQVISLLSIQRSTPNLPFTLIVPGRSLLKRGMLYQLERNESPKEREFLLFSDCMVWFSKGGEDGEWRWSPLGGSSDNLGEILPSPNRIYETRSRAISETNLPLLGSGLYQSSGNVITEHVTNSTLSSPQSARRRIQPNPMPIPLSKLNSGSNSGDERWVYKGRLDIVDIEVVVPPASDWREQRRIEILSPDGSFALYAESEQDRDDWVSTIRQAKSQLLSSISVMNPNSTLTSSCSTNHVRRSLQALPFPPTDPRLATVRERVGYTPILDSAAAGYGANERRRRVEHWVPAIWIPDEKTKECMRCGRLFGWRRRRHHCRLCGRCVCAHCSDKIFYIADSNVIDKSGKPARACNICYETVFPIIDSPASPSPYGDDDGLDHTITSLSHFPAWLSMPLSVVPTSTTQPMPTPQALMALESNGEMYQQVGGGLGEIGEARKVRVRRRSQSFRPMSYVQVLEGFSNRDSRSGGENGENEEMGLKGADENSKEANASDEGGLTGTVQAGPKIRVEDTIKKRQRFSLPAVALQPLSVIAHTVGEDHNHSGGSEVDDERSGREELMTTTTKFTDATPDPVAGVGATPRDRERGGHVTKRLSLLLAGRTQVSVVSGGEGRDQGGGDQGGTNVSVTSVQRERARSVSKAPLVGGSRSLLMEKLSELLNNSRSRG